MRSRSHRASAALALVALVSASLPARADTKAECAKAYESSQEQRGQDKLREARKSLVTCSQAGCPSFIKKDCAKWLAEVESSIPTVVFSAKAGGDDVTDVKVTLGDEVLAESLDGKAVPMDPGSHTFVFESAKYGKRDLKYVVKEGQKAQNISLSFEAPKTDSGDKGGGGGGGSGDKGAGHGDKGTTISSETAKGSKTLGYVFLGVGAIGLGGFAFFGLSGKSDQNKLACAETKTCTDSELDPIKKKYLYADISLGVGVASLALGTFFLLKSPSKSESPAGESAKRLRFDVGPARGGGFASVSGAF